MAAVWAEVLGTSCVGRNDHFVFDLAGNSLLALQLIDRVNRRFGVRFTIPDILSTPTVATMCEKVASRGKRSREAVRYLEIVRSGHIPAPRYLRGLRKRLSLCNRRSLRMCRSGG